MSSNASRKTSSESFIESSTSLYQEGLYATTDFFERLREKIEVKFNSFTRQVLRNKIHTDGTFLASIAFAARISNKQDEPLMIHLRPDIDYYCQVSHLLKALYQIRGNVVHIAYAYQITEMEGKKEFLPVIFRFESAWSSDTKKWTTTRGVMDLADPEDPEEVISTDGQSGKTYFSSAFSGDKESIEQLVKESVEQLEVKESLEQLEKESVKGEELVKVPLESRCNSWKQGVISVPSEVDRSAGTEPSESKSGSWFLESSFEDLPVDSNLPPAFYEYKETKV